MLQALHKYNACWNPPQVDNKEPFIYDNHFLRILENGVKIRAVEIENAKISVDTKDDLEEVTRLMKKDQIKLF